MGEASDSRSEIGFLGVRHEQRRSSGAAAAAGENVEAAVQLVCGVRGVGRGAELVQLLGKLFFFSRRFKRARTRIWWQFG